MTFLRQFLLLIAVLWSSAPSAQTAPPPETWVMYQVGLSGNLPFYEDKHEAAAENFRLATFSGPTTCRAYYFDNLAKDFYRNARWRNGQWEDCVPAPGWMAYEVAPKVNCSRYSIDARCHVRGSTASLKNIGAPKCGQPTCGNPFTPTSGNKHQAEADFTVPGSPWLSFTRYHNSSPFTKNSGVFGMSWSHSFDYRIHATYGRDTLYLTRPDGSIHKFTSGLVPEDDEPGRLVRWVDSSGVALGWQYDNGLGQLEYYGLDGRIKSISFTGGGGLKFEYTTDASPQLRTVTDHFGRSVTFNYNTAYQKVISVTAPSGAVHSYTYAFWSKLASVVRPGSAVRQYGWDATDYDASSPVGGQLILLTDEAGGISSYRYDKSAKVISTEAPGGVNKFTAAYADGGNTVKLPLGATRIFTTATVQGRTVAVGSTTSCANGGCSQTTSASYDVNGNLISSTDEAGVKTCRAYDARNLLTLQVTGLSAAADCASALFAHPAEARVVSISWHAAVRKPVAIAEPLKLTTIDYDEKLRQRTITEAATDDPNGGLGFAATLGHSRVTSFTYNEFGQVTSIQGPRSGASETFQYDSAGNLTEHRNALGHTTTYSAFDGDGRPGAMTLPSGAGMTLGYDARGQLSTMTIAGETTTLTYNPVGNVLTTATPDGEKLTFGYDTAQRLTSVTDLRGNKVSMTLNALGQPITTNVASSNGTIVQTVTRVFDALGRLKQITGAQGL